MIDPVSVKGAQPSQCKKEKKITDNGDYFDKQKYYFNFKEAEGILGGEEFDMKRVS